MNILRSSDYTHMPWKNGGGDTVEIAVFPSGASLDDFDWRISMATVAADGPFSAFPGVDRTLTVIEGQGVDLTIDGNRGASVRLNTLPYTFPADSMTDARLIDGPVRDLNIMTRRGRFGHQVCKTTIIGDRDIGTAFVWTFVLSISHNIVEIGGTSLGHLDAIILGPGENNIISSLECADVILAKICAA